MHCLEEENKKKFDQINKQGNKEASEQKEERAVSVVPLTAFFFDFKSLI